MKISTIMLCDAASVRDGLLHVLGGGLNILWREAYPAPMGCTLALMIEGQIGDVSPDKPLQLAITIFADNVDGPVVVRFDGELTAIADGSGARNFITPVVYNLDPVPLPGPGTYHLTVQLEQLEPISIVFDSEFAIRRDSALLSTD